MKGMPIETLRKEYQDAVYKDDGFRMACLKSIYYRYADKLKEMTVDEQRQFCKAIGIEGHAKPEILVKQMVRMWEYDQLHGS